MTDDADQKATDTPVATASAPNLGGFATELARVDEWLAVEGERG